jgi:type IV secretion/conjugal transfer VirB4 family ATPase
VLRREFILRRARETGALNGLLNLYGFLDDHVFLTKSGDLGVVLEIKGVDYEGLEPSRRDLVARRFESALRLLDERFRLLQYLIKQRGPVIPEEAHPNEVTDRALRARRAFLEGRRKDLFDMDLFFVVLFEGTGRRRCLSDRVTDIVHHPRAALADWLSASRTLNLVDEELERARQQLLVKVEAFVVQLEDTIAPTIATRRSAFQFLRRLLNYEPEKAGLRQTPSLTFLDCHLADSALECHRGFLRLDDDYVQVLTLKDPPSRTYAHLLQSLYEVPANFIAVTEWHREEPGAIRRAIQAKRRHFHNSKASLSNYLNSSPTAPQDLLIDEGAVALVSDLGACLREIELQGRFFGECSLTVAVWDKDRADLSHAVAECLKAFAAHDAAMIQERPNLLNAWLSTIPGGSAYNLRYLYLLSTNYADLSFLFSLHRGSATNPHLRREYLAILETTHRTPFYLNLHHQDVAHTVVLGATGSGKSFLLNFLLTHVQKYDPYTMIFDLGGSYRQLTRHFRGSDIHMGLGRRTFTINPFTLPSTKEHLQFLFSFVKVLLQSNGQYAMSLDDDRDLYEQIANVYQVDPDQRRLFTLANILRRPLGQYLQRWVQSGQYADLFDHVEDTLTFARFQCFDFEGMEKYPQVLEPLLFYVLHRANAAIYDPAQASVFKVFVLDEAWRFMRDPTINAYITEALKTWRKQNAALILATQSSEDLTRSAMLRVVVESCANKILLANPNLDRQAYRDLFGLNDTEIDLVASLIPRQQMLVKRSGLSKVLNLHVDAEALALYTNARDTQHDNDCASAAKSAIDVTTGRA